ncbi:MULTISPECIES: phenylacetate--CoA ligase family protein [unclassified Microcoleus]|uniref:phenylacetate--CoA ligase family protein n=1 Tax=unclassified Microcoleus TaxID=2642155 RepID=UPI0025D946F7|nr:MULTISPECIES: phenylacetate--CoA ligase family protein [unclassified Microcoleus]
MQPEPRQRAIGAFEQFLSAPLEERLQQQSRDAESEAIALFHNVAATVPAYQKFLAALNINPESIQTLEDFQKLPLITKENYLRFYPLPQLCRQGKLETCDFIAVSSGSTGNPTFWPRFISDELQIADRFEQIFHDSFFAETRRTLAVICFALGTWVGGMYTANCCRYLASKGYPVTVVTPGNNKTEIFRAVRELGEHFEQVVLLGYPPFIKDVIDSGIAAGVEWQKYRIKMVFAGEVFSEEWRSLVSDRINYHNTKEEGRRKKEEGRGGDGEMGRWGEFIITNSELPITNYQLPITNSQLSTENLYYNSASLYGTADAGVLGNETPLSICIRRWFANNPEAARNLFGESRLPTLVQYDPKSRFFEVNDDGTLLFSGDNGIPLIRYHISDNGGLISYEAMLDFLAEWGFNPVAHLQEVAAGESAGLPRGIRNLPFVYVFGRSHFTVSYFGANIYPENVTVGLEVPTVSEWVTGKFVLQVKEDADRNRFLSVVVELAAGVEGDEEMKVAIASSILAQLRRLNSEFANYVPPEYQLPVVTLTAMGDAEYFPMGVKHRYTRQ